MKISLNWLKDYIKLDIKKDELSCKLTMAGLEVEAVTSVGADTVFELEITPNRPDCLNMLGMSREVSAILNKPRKTPTISSRKKIKDKCDITIDKDCGCARYIGTLIENVKVGKTPDWIKKRIEALGLRSINNVVDITNFTLMEMGQPLHAFDYDKLIGGKIIVRRAKKGEKIVTIDEEERELDPSILVIADDKRPVAIAGVMGGKETEVTSRTKNILLESAYFDPILIRRASRKLGLTSDSSYRFERGVFFDAVETGSTRAIDLILESLGGVITKTTDLIAYKLSKKPNNVTLSLEAINSFLGSALTLKNCTSVLNNLGFIVSTSGRDKIKTTAPLFREDIKQVVDVIEEIARIVGFGNIPSSLPFIKASNILPDESRIKRERLRDVLISSGLNEIVTYSLISKKNLEQFNQSVDFLSIINPLTQDQEVMRPTMLPSMLSVASGNINKKQKDIKLFEIGKTYGKDKEKEVLSIIMSGQVLEDWRQLSKKDCDYYDIKGCLEQAIKRVGVRELKFCNSQHQFLEAGVQASVMFKDKAIGCVGQVSDEVLKRWGIKQGNVFFAEVILDKILEIQNKKKSYKTITEYPSIVYDISLAVDKKIRFSQIKEIAFELGTDILFDVQFKEEYLGDKIANNMRGVIFSLTYQSPTKTLTEQEVSLVHNKINQELINRLSAIKR
ncbi:MAG: phenylalanine--tRNA ligase subunit beta [Candidatus Zapsychrus exili]|nr:phenylalanine--tRNA ligase subunit beta [Candidatus Zapsychrus exili]